MSGVGTELKRIIPAIFESKGCKCRDKAATYNAWGVAGCEKRKALIVTHLVAQAKKHKLAGKLPTVVTKAVAERWVTTAIERAKQNGKK